MQKSLSLKNIFYSVGDKSILEDISIKCHKHERICLFGENGAGKSTLLKIIAGEILPHEGSVQTEDHTRFTYVAQEFDKKHNELTTQDYICKQAGPQYLGKAYTLAEALGYKLIKVSGTPCKNLSGGQQKILSLVVAVAQDPDYLLLDEPENHLDIVSRLALLRLLTTYNGGIIFVSHDRLLIDSIATKIAEIIRGELHISNGGYAEYIDSKMNRIGSEQRLYDKETKRIKEINKSLGIMQQKAALGKATAQYKARKQELEDLKAAHKLSARPSDRKTTISLSQKSDSLHSGKLLIRAEKVSFAYGETKPIFKETSLEVRSGAKIVLLGRNGSGKSTFLKCLTQELMPTSGSVTVAPNIAVAYFDQHAGFTPSHSALQVLGDTLHLSETAAMTALGAVKFDLGRMKSPCEILSGGERMRLRFVIAFGQQPDLLILDEPTNHIDEVTWEVLLEACNSFSGTILLVSHDYEFIEQFLPTHFWMMEKGTVVDRQKTFSYLIGEMGATLPNLSR